MVDLYEQYQCSIVAIEEVPIDATESYGVIAGEKSLMAYSGFQRWSKNPNLRMLLQTSRSSDATFFPDIFDKIESTPPGRNGEVQITDALAMQAAEGNVIGYKFKDNDSTAAVSRVSLRRPTMCFPTTTLRVGTIQ